MKGVHFSDRENDRVMKKTVYLCGFMGCGKTTVGRLLAEMSGLAYCDMDDYIEKTEGMTIPEIFAGKGEAYFRERETDAVAALGERGGIISCGGGAMLKDINAETAAKYGTVVYIDTPFEVCWERISGDTNRPLVMANTKESLEDIYNYRKELYSKHSSVRADGRGTPRETAVCILEKIRK